MREYGRKSSSSGKSVGTRSVRRHKSPGKSPAKTPSKKNEKGEITTWDTNNQDGRELKIYIENGCCEGLTAKPVREKYPQFKKYCYSTFNSAFTNARKTFNHQVRKRAKGLCEFFFAQIYFYRLDSSHYFILFI